MIDVDIVTIKVEVEKVVEGNDVYYLATSPDMKGFMAEADSYEEVKVLSQQILSDMIVAKKEREQKAKRLAHQRKRLFETAYYLYERQSMALSY